MNITIPSSDWRETRNGVTGLTKECIGYENGVLRRRALSLDQLCRSRRLCVQRGVGVSLHTKLLQSSLRDAGLLYEGAFFVPETRPHHPKAPSLRELAKPTGFA